MDRTGGDTELLLQANHEYWRINDTNSFTRTSLDIGGQIKRVEHSLYLRRRTILSSKTSTKNYIPNTEMWNWTPAKSENLLRTFWVTNITKWENGAREEFNYGDIFHLYCNLIILLSKGNQPFKIPTNSLNEIIDYIYIFTPPPHDET